ncbi:hypothetical protein WDU94_011142 [Cyamophila willieti]
MTSTTRRVVTFSISSDTKPVTTPNGDHYTNDPCICERPNAKVLCKRCGFLLENGRVRTPCFVHPQTFYLLDIESCPKCNSSSALIELHPYDLQRDYKDLPSPMNISPPKLEVEDTPGVAPDERKNFFHRTKSMVDSPVLENVSTNTAKNRRTKGASAYRYAPRNDGRGRLI